MSDQESPAGSAGLVADIDSFLLLGPLNPKFSSDAILPVLQRARDQIVELKSSGDVAEIRTLLALKSQFAAQQERIAAFEAELVQLRTPVGDEEVRAVTDGLRGRHSHWNGPMVADLLERLARDREYLKNEAAELGREVIKLRATSAAAQARAEKAERDTKRLDWLDANPSLTIRSGKQHIRPLIDATMNTRVSEEKT